MTPLEIQGKIELYRQALSMVFSKSIADRTVIKYFENDHGVTFWVNRAFSTDKGIRISPTGFKPFSPAEFDVETRNLFNQAKEAELRLSEVKIGKEN